MTQATTFFLRQQAQSYVSRLRSWSVQIRGAGTALEACRAASHAPHPPSIIASLKYLYSREQGAAVRDVERILDKWIDEIDPKSPQIPDILRFLQGHWPRLYQRLDAKRRAAHL